MGELIDLTRQQFGRLTVIGRSSEKSKHGMPQWDCVCNCGRTKRATASSLKGGDCRSCGCIKGEIEKERREALIGKRYGKITVVGVAEKRNKKELRVKCLCDCGKEFNTNAAWIRAGRTKSCGCANMEAMRKAKVTHGRTGTPEYRAWKSMRRRCNNRNTKDYQEYGGKGIVVCERWNNFQNFYDDMGQKPGKEYSLDRINNDLGYSRENCRWSTMKEQARNRRNVTVLEYQGEKATVSEWAKAIGVGIAEIARKARMGWGIEDIVKEKNKAVSSRRKNESAKSEIKRIWRGITARCTDPANQAFKRYGGKGIGICERWKDFNNFYQDVGDRPGKEYSLDRINNDLGYSRENCRWSTVKEQARNRRSCIKIIYEGEEATIAEWAERKGVNAQNLRKRITKYGWSAERAIETPMKRKS